MKSKKAAIELSVTAIVVLILAIVMLGLGLGFIRGMFSKVSVNLEEQIATEPEPPLPSSSDPITLSRGTIIVHAKDTGALKVAVYNPANSPITTQPSLNCTGNLISGNSIGYSRLIEQGQSKTFGIMYTISSSASPGTTICRVIANTNITTKYNPEIDLILRVVG